jgi:hypothetical protein
MCRRNDQIARDLGACRRAALDLAEQAMAGALPDEVADRVDWVSVLEHVVALASSKHRHAFDAAVLLVQACPNSSPA